MHEFIARNVEVHPNHQLLVEDSVCDLLDQMILQIEQLCKQFEVVSVLLVRVRKDLSNFIFQLVDDNPPLPVNGFFLLLVDVLLGEGKHCFANGNQLLYFLGYLVDEMVEVVLFHL